MTELRVGMIVPPAGDAVPPEAYDLYPEGIDFVARSLSIAGVEPRSFDIALERLPSAIDYLLDANVDAISLMGTSISFYRGWEGHKEILARLRELSHGKPVTNMAHSIIRELEEGNAKNIVVGSAYNRELSTSLLSFVEEGGFHVLDDAHLELTSVHDVFAVGPDDVYQLGRRLIEKNPQAEALLISCGGLRTIEASEKLEVEFGIPVISSAVAACHDVVRLATGSREVKPAER